MNLKDKQRQKIQNDWPRRRRERVKPGRLARGSELSLARHEAANLVETWNHGSASPLNRRVRTRMHGGVGGGEPRGSPLSRSARRQRSVSLSSGHCG